MLQLFSFNLNKSEPETKNQDKAIPIVAVTHTDPEITFIPSLNKVEEYIPPILFMNGTNKEIAKFSKSHISGILGKPNKSTKVAESIENGTKVITENKNYSWQAPSRKVVLTYSKKKLCGKY